MDTFSNLPPGVQQSDLEPATHPVPTPFDITNPDTYLPDDWPPDYDEPPDYSGATPGSR